MMGVKAKGRCYLIDRCHLIVLCRQSPVSPVISFHYNTSSCWTYRTNAQHIAQAIEKHILVSMPNITYVRLSPLLREIEIQKGRESHYKSLPPPVSQTTSIGLQLFNCFGSERRYFSPSDFLYPKPSSLSERNGKHCTADKEGGFAFRFS